MSHNCFMLKTKKISHQNWFHGSTRNRGLGSRDPRNKWVDPGSNFSNWVLSGGSGSRSGTAARPCTPLVSQVIYQSETVARHHQTPRHGTEIFRVSLEQQGQRIDKIALSSSPSLSRSYAVMIAYHFAFGVPWLALHRSGEDAWRGVSPATHLRPIEVLQLIYYDGLFVALDAENHITTLNERESHMESRLVIGQKFEGRPYLVECSGSLLVAWETRGAGGNRFRVYEVDLEKGTQEEVESLGKASLFLNDNSSFSMEFDATSCVPGFKPNHVYFTDYADEKKKIYSMENGKVETYSDAIGLRHAGQWFQPDF
ncbi:uncharacterized protein LOC120290206 [Eucalyptus grandis]|uniref:uncharacterized protein LOC120290206 n=1 Tax=Eucalyptus grandis TaxID=71139 RepID=UPI00192E8F07|nr:uncharacterized protein LOC120290206 [Eucalyptus grandis]XP_039161927.1 uncharacterized protein LOC120290206 [Eucalyptus grandis]XP_039161928.1 uncharacterized protein LOC120290206 [Eucalyptus grandis]XP_039161929.1 uncharacterized protein LOC120290206 [Eucalyptus grandis]XP_039161930.1 uncharacterized protein LOC120290206 [Eucalyptus grandis]